MANMAVAVNLVPVTGVTLPLVSMGGSSFLFTCASIGIVLSVARNVEQIEGREPIISTVSESDSVKADNNVNEPFKKKIVEREVEEVMN
jgi:cell division protein FtsW